MPRPAIPCAPPPPARPQVVLVEDDAPLADALSFSLDIEGFEVHVYRSAGAVQAARMPRTGCLVIDYRLPGESGLALLTRLRAADVALPAILMTSHATARVRANAEALTVTVVEKPLLGEALVGAIHAAMDRAEAT